MIVGRRLHRTALRPHMPYIIDLFDMSPHLSCCRIGQRSGPRRRYATNVWFVYQRFDRGIDVLHASKETLHDGFSSPCVKWSSSLRIEDLCCPCMEKFSSSRSIRWLALCTGNAPHLSTEPCQSATSWQCCQFRCKKFPLRNRS